ncbi:hypothetical protein AB0L14_30645 [Streptomyces sp. NPDC052727]|uniref:hypothetical protein n=1 Tax=Streptomyces sp. NPDC052727 TaxID=3154854 RepID=UPI0034321326
MSTDAVGAEAFLAALTTAAPAPPADTRVPDGVWHLLTALYEELPGPVADGWARAVHGALRAGPPAGGLWAVHAWQAGTVLPLLATAWPDDASGAVADLAALHRAATRAPVAYDSWQTALRPVLLRVYGAAYDHRSAYAEAHTNARSYALAHGHTPAEADAYGHRYAGLSTDANAASFAEAHARAVGDALALAYAGDRAEPYAATYPAAQVRAVVRALERPAPPAPADAAGTGTAGEPQPAVTLAHGLTDVLRLHRDRRGAGGDTEAPVDVPAAPAR